MGRQGLGLVPGRVDARRKTKVLAVDAGQPEDQVEAKKSETQEGGAKVKIKISFVLDLKGTNYDADKPQDLQFSLDLIGQLMQKLHQAAVREKLDWLADEHGSIKAMAQGDKAAEKRIRDAAKKMSEDDIQVTNQVFHDYRLEGELNGVPFVFTHQEPGYRETFTFDGKPADIRELRSPRRKKKP